MKNLIKYALFALFSLLISSLFSQVKKKIELTFSQGASTFNPSTGAMNQSPGSYRFRLEGENKYRRLGSGAMLLRPYLEDCPEAIKHLDTYKSTKTTALVIGILSVTSFVAFAAINIKKINDGQEGSTAAMPLLVLTAVGGLTTTMIGSSADGHVFNAVEAYNESLENPQTYMPIIQPEFEQHYNAPTRFNFGISIPIH